MRRTVKASPPTVLACVLALVLPGVVPRGAPAQTTAGPPPPPSLPADARALGYRMSGLGLRAESSIRLPVARSAVPPHLFIPVRRPGAAPPGDSAAAVPPGRRRPPVASPDRSGEDGRPRRVIVFVSEGPEGPGRAVEVVHGGVAPGETIVRECARVRIRLQAGTVRTARLALDRLEAQGLEEVRSLLLRRMEERGVLSLVAVDGTRLSVPARLVDSLRVEPCGRGGGE